MFLNARGRYLPWTFAANEDEFCLLARMPPCRDYRWCNQNVMDFTKLPQPGAYGAYRYRSDGSTHYHGGQNEFETCARNGILVLSIQSRIMKFLAACAIKILHDIPEEGLLDFPLQEEPSKSDLLDFDIAGHSRFSDVLMTAPYRGWHSLNFTKLHGYITATLDTQKEHIWALREDPSYFADTILEFEEHTNQSGLKQHLTLSAKMTQRNAVVRSIVEEAYCTLAGWQELHQRFADFDKLFQDDVNIYEQIYSVYEVQNVAEWMKDNICRTIASTFGFAPNFQRVLRSDRDKITDAQAELFHRLETFTKFETLTAISSSLETIDRLIQGHNECKAMMSSRILSLLTEVSVLTECLRQIGLWERSPEVLACCAHMDRDHTPTLGERGDFLPWAAAMKDQAFPFHHLYPYQEKLHYPANKRHSRNHVEAMCRAEANLDKFWAAVDSMFEERTGTAQHEIIYACLTHAGKMHRTVPWVEPAIVKPAPKKKQEYEYQPLSRMVHNKTLQITGAFDKLSIEEKTKTKTRGTADHAIDAGRTLTVQPVANSTQQLDKPFIVDQRTHKVFKTIFYTPTSETGDLPKAVKWAEFKRAMARVGFAVEKLQGSAWQFSPSEISNAERNIQFHEPHPDSDVPYVMAKRFGRRLARVYGWSADMFKLA